MVDPMMRRFFDGVLGDPVLLQAELEKRRKQAPPVVVRLERGVAPFEVGHELGCREGRKGDAPAVVKSPGWTVA